MKQWLRDKRLLVDDAVGTVLSLLPPRPYLEMKWRYYNLSRSKKELEHARSKRTMITSESYSFIPFDDTKAIFVHIPKCAGVSVCRALFGNLAGGHTTLDEYLNIFEPRYIESYFKFTIVRNPWDRLVSAFHFMQSGGFNEEDRNWFSGELGHFKDFEEFVKGWLNKNNIWKWPHFRPQYHYIVERKGKVKMDCVGFLENIEEDFRYVTKRLGVDCSLQQSNKGNHDDYRSYYNEETMKIVADVYDTDIKLLGYNFDNSSLPAQLAKRSSGTALDLTAPGLHKGRPMVSMASERFS
jgi:hypothetical protein